MPTKKISHLIVLLLSAVSVSVGAEPVSLPTPTAVTSLRDAYFRALQNNERIAISEQTIRQAEGLYRQTLGLSFPDVSFQHTSTFQDRTGRPRTGTTVQSPQNEGRFSTGITGLTGYREMAAVRAGKSTIRQQERALERAEQLLLSDIAAAFYGLLQSEENAKSTARLIELGQKRSKELNERVRVGRSRDVEAIEQDFQNTTLQSQLEETQRLVASQQDLLGFLVNAPVNDVAADDNANMVTPAPLETYLARIDSRPDIEAAIDTIDISKNLVKIARSEYLPRLNLSANYYLYRPEVRDYIDWDAAVGVDVPLLAWGARKGLVDASTAELHIREQEWRAARRQAELDIRNGYRNLISARKQLEFQTKAVDLARRDYELQARDDRRGLVTNLDVLESLNRLNSAELAMNNAKLFHRLTLITLEVAAGAKPEDILK